MDDLINNKEFLEKTIVFQWDIKNIEDDEDKVKGKGGFGKVLRAFDGKLNKHIAIKLI